MEIIETAIPDVKVLVPQKHFDSRGFFAEVYSRKAFAAAGMHIEFVQDNQSLSSRRGVLRGLHFQAAPKAQDKLIRVIRGSILDVAVDIRRGSRTFGRHVAVVLSAENFKQLLVPIGFAHGFLVLEPETEVAYKVSDGYSAAHERGVIWNDPAIGIDWGISPAEVLLSDKDCTYPRLADCGDLF